MDPQTIEVMDEADNTNMDYKDESDLDVDDDDDDDDVSTAFSEELGDVEGKTVVGRGGVEEEGEEKINKQEYITNFLEGKLSFDEYAAKMVKLNDECVSSKSSDILNVSEMQGTSVDESVTSEELGKVSLLKKPKQRHVRQNLPPALKGLMGEANLRYARGDKDMAVKICVEIIRQVPTAPEPYQTLAGLYEESGLVEKSLQMAMIAAHLSPGDPDQWVRLAELCQEQGNPKQAVRCYTKAIQADKKNCDVYFKRAELLNELGHKHLALKGLSKLLTILDHTQGDQILHLSKMLAEKYHEEKDLLKTKETLKAVFDKCPKLVTSEHINLLLEVQLALGEYSDCLSLMISFCNVEAELVTDDSDQYVVAVCTAPSNMAIDLRVKLIITLIHMKSLPPVYKFLNDFLETNPEELGDLYLDIAEALMMENYHSDALKLLQPLISSANYSLPGVWLKYAECLKKVNRLKESVDAYMFVIEQAPQHHDARLVVADLLRQLGRGDEAIVVLTQDEKNESLNAGLLYERCLLLSDRLEHRDEFLVICQLFFSRHFTQIRTHEELRALSLFSRVSKKRAAIKEIRLTQGLDVEDERPAFMETSRLPTVEEEWQLFKKLVYICFEEKRYALLQRITFSAQGSERFSIPYSKQLDIYCLIASFYNKESNLAYNFIRNMVIKNIDCVRLWNFFNIHVIRGDHCRHNKFIMRLLARRQNHTILSLLHANNCLVSGTYKYALNEYTATFKRDPTPMLAFLVGVTLCQMACQKFSAKKHSLVTQVIAFFAEYNKLRGKESAQEFHYNLGRVHHQLGLLSTAVFHYKEALASEPVLDSPMLDLKQEIAYNLHLIYRSSGAHDVARMYLEKYVVV
ncbi:general transcription factor 3C polypeptide 3 [Nilaparvata lugens]|uniref:general transcription factor 3C polypeptide 3 n=1 Tax=Nilaparvata lugens TaxID=108931 RepID=UPI00193CF42B|nr:general transcription factor 3C polypeptide 3 [Nilaparvata lugens]XP_022186686.2 general transcription factor 3C polypeptide 3 [Nilaparvata lugens]XP_039293851.1 general transcription factor 3C polypeptide 3 [Nilaparvata lugens]